jgi:tetratricopeptide (TPR) repeat protein
VAEPFYRRSLAIKERVLGGDHPQVASTLYNTGLLLLQLGRFEDAASPLQRTLEIFEQVLPPGHPNLSYPLHSLGNLHSELQQLAVAEDYFVRALEIRDTAVSEDDPELRQLREDYADLLRATGRADEAARLLGDGS